MRRQRRVKIVATLGPASSDRKTIGDLFEAGVDVFRINMSHTPHDKLKALVETIRAVEKEAARPICILVDLQGPKLRVGEVEGGSVELPAGARFVLDNDPRPGDASRAHLPHPEVLDALAPGHALLVDDGKVRLRVLDKAPGRVEAEVEVAGKLLSRKGVSVPDTVLPLSAMTDKDRADLDYALTLGIDWVAASFVQRAEDVADIRRAVRGRALIMVKVEKPHALGHMNEIMDLSDGLMVARGDLGVEMPLESVPGTQKSLTRAARRAGKPVVIATQMLESMIQAPVPTRAEVSDVATAVFEGADAVMLSAESAAGAYPVEAVATMDRIARSVEQDPHYSQIIHAQRAEPEATAADAISAAARQVAETLSLACIISWTFSGATAMRASRERPSTPIIALTPNAATARRLAMVWGLHCVLTEDIRDSDDMVERACRIASQEGYAKPGQRVIISAGVPFGSPGATNMLRIAFVGQDTARDEAA